MIKGILMRTDILILEHLFLCNMQSCHVITTGAYQLVNFLVMHVFIVSTNSCTAITTQYAQLLLFSKMPACIGL